MNETEPCTANETNERETRLNKNQLWEWQKEAKQNPISGKRNNFAIQNQFFCLNRKKIQEVGALKNNET